MKRREFGERWSFLWLIAATIAIIGLIFSIVPGAEEEVIEVTIEEFEKVTVKLEERNSTEHVEELETGLLINANELEILARIIHGESGSNWCSDTMQLYVGSVFLNRVADKDFPNTFEEVAFQDNGRQYSCTRKGKGYWETPTERDFATATYLLMNGSQLESDYVWQSNFEQGTDIIKVQNMYFGRKE